MPGSLRIRVEVSRNEIGIRRRTDLTFDTPIVSRIDELDREERDFQFILLESDKDKAFVVVHIFFQRAPVVNVLSNCTGANQA